MKYTLLALLFVFNFSTEAATCYFSNESGHSILVNTTELHDVIQSNMVDENIVDRSMFHKTYSIYDSGITYRVDQVNRSCGKGCEIGTFLVGIKIQSESYIPQFAQKCLL